MKTVSRFALNAEFIKNTEDLEFFRHFTKFTYCACNRLLMLRPLADVSGNFQPAEKCDHMWPRPPQTAVSENR